MTMLESYKQVIGARYVPKFYENSHDPSSSQWEANVLYEPLTIVFEDNDTYTSKKPVPKTVGKPSENPTYWAHTGDYNATLQSVVNHINDVERSVNNISNVEIPALDNRLDLLENKNIIFVGDSYSVGAASTTHYPDVCAECLGLDSNHYHVLGHSGWGFANNDFYSLISGYSGDKTKITDIVVLGGLNDAAKLDDTLTDNQLISLIETFMEYCNTNFVNAQVWVGVLGWSKNTNSSSANIRKYNRMEKCYTRAVQWGAKYIDGFLSIVHNYDILGDDNVHPTDNGQIRIGRALASRLQDGDLKSNTSQLDITLTSSQETSGLPSVCFQNIDKNNVYLFMVGTIEFTSGISFSLHQQRNILTMSDGYIDAGNLGSFIDVMVEVTDSNDNLTFEPARIVLSGKNINIAFASFTGTVKKIKFNAMTYTLNIYTV